MTLYRTNVGRWGISEALRSYVEQMPYERRSLLARIMPLGGAAKAVRA